jgi:hypothetical protein
MMAITCLICLTVSAIWTHTLLVRVEAYWQGGEFIRATGVSSNEIYNYWTWLSYYTFQDYVAEVENSEEGNAGDFFNRWLPERREQAQFLVTESTEAPPGESWEIIAEIPYQSILFSGRKVYVVKKQSQAP